MATIRVSASGIPDEDVTATESDDDTLIFETTTNAVTVPEGGSAGFQVRLNAQPLSTVSATVSRVSGDGDITVSSGTSLTFTTSNWSTYQPVTLTAAEDADVVNGVATIRVSASGIPDEDVTATESDDDTLIFETTTNAVTVPEGGSAGFQVRLNAQPLSTVSATVSRVSGDGDITVSSGTSLTFTTSNWSTYQPVTLTAAEDADVVNGVATIRVSASGIPDKDVTATESEVGALSVTPTAGLTSSGIQGGPFNPSSQIYTLENIGGAAINWTVSNTQSWVNLSSPPGNTLSAGGSTTVMVSINSGANSLSPGSHADTVSFANTTNGNGDTTRNVTLSVIEIQAPWDFNNDSITNYLDLGLFADHWLLEEDDSGWDSLYNLHEAPDPVNGKQIINFLDLGIFADHWLEITD